MRRIADSPVDRAHAGRMRAKSSRKMRTKSMPIEMLARFLICYVELRFRKINLGKTQKTFTVQIVNKNNSPFITSEFSLNLQEWCAKMFIGTKREWVRHYVSTNLSRGQVSFNRAQMVKWAASDMKRRPCGVSEREAFKTCYRARRAY